MWTTCFLFCSKLPTPWGFNCSSSNIIDWQFSRLSCFLTNGISLCSDEVEMQKLQRSGQAHFLGASSPDSFPPDRFALHRSCVWLKCEPACRLKLSSILQKIKIHPKSFIRPFCTKAFNYIVMTNFCWVFCTCSLHMELQLSSLSF